MHVCDQSGACVGHGCTYSTARSQERAEPQEADAVLLLRHLVEALETAYISSWQGTHHWDKELAEAREYLNQRDGL